MREDDENTLCSELLKLAEEEHIQNPKFLKEERAEEEDEEEAVEDIGGSAERILEYLNRINLATKTLLEDNKSYSDKSKKLPNMRVSLADAFLKLIKSSEDSQAISLISKRSGE